MILYVCLVGTPIHLVPGWRLEAASRRLRKLPLRIDV